jgi:hypothetical protein
MAGTENPHGAVHAASTKMAPVIRTELKACEKASIAITFRRSKAAAKKLGFAAKV